MLCWFITVQLKVNPKNVVLATTKHPEDVLILCIELKDIKIPLSKGSLFMLNVKT
jgi:hypothetical protein